MSPDQGFLCHRCSQRHPGPPMAFGLAAPDYRSDDLTADPLNAPYPPSTLNLKTILHTRPLGERPLIELEPTDHPLAVEQRNGITLTRVQEVAEALTHPA